MSSRQPKPTNKAVHALRGAAVGVEAGMRGGAKSGGGAAGRQSSAAGAHAGGSEPLSSLGRGLTGAAPPVSAHQGLTTGESRGGAGRSDTLVPAYNACL